MSGLPLLRELTWLDIPAVASLDAIVFGAEAWSEATWWTELAARPRRVYAVLEDSGPDTDSGHYHHSASERGRRGNNSPERPPGASVGGLAGYAGLSLSGDVADVMTIAVAPDRRGRGYGRVLLDWLTQTADSAGAARVLLEVRADNVDALGLYRHSGFATVTVRPRYYQPSDVDAVVMSRRLG